jgi:hypothetical protein
LRLRRWQRDSAATLIPRACSRVAAAVATECLKLMVQAAGDGVAERSLSSLDVSLCSLPVCSHGGAGGCWSQSAVGVSDAVLEAVGLDAMCGLLPGASRTRLLGEWSERDGQVRLDGGFEGTVPAALTENRGLGLDRGGALSRGLVLEFRSPAGGKAAGKFSFALRGLHDLVFGGLEALAFEGEPRWTACAATKNAARSALEFGDSRACLVDDALCFGPRFA